VVDQHRQQDPEDHDELDDPEAARLLHRFGRTMAASGGGALFPPPSDRGALHRALDAVDLERTASPRRIRRALVVLAAALPLLAALWVVVTRERPPAATPTLAALRLSLAPGTERDAGQATRFRSGDRVYLHLASDRPSFAFVALLDSDRQLLPVSADVRSLPAAPSTLGPFELDGHPGLETFLVLAGVAARSRADFVALIQAAARSLEGTAADHAAALERVMRVLRAQPGLSCAAATFEHLPR